MKIKLTTVAGALAALMFSSHAAEAKIFSFTYEGYASGSDYGNRFGFGATPLDYPPPKFYGEHYTATYITDDTDADVYSQFGGWIMNGGPFYGAPVVTVAKITINNSVFNIVGADSSQTVAGSFLNSEVSELIDDYRPRRVYHYVDPFDHRAPGFAFGLPGRYEAAGSGLLTYYVPELQRQDRVDFTITSVTIAINSGVPEPEGWALMIGGFGAAGAMLRRRRTAALTAP